MEKVLDAQFCAQLLCLVIILGTPIIAYLKGRNVFLWMLFALIGSLFAFIAILCLSKQKRCPMCNERIDAKAKICKHCHSELE